MSSSTLDILKQPMGKYCKSKWRCLASCPPISVNNQMLPPLVRYITQEGHKLEVALKPPPAVTNAVSWRTEGVKYRKNEVFLDVIESVDLLAGASGNVLRSEIVGCIKMRVYLSGMPELRLGLNDKVLFESTGRGKSKSVELEDVKFHQCVRLSRFDNDRTISFIPPDGEFELMSYRLNTHVSSCKRHCILSSTSDPLVPPHLVNRLSHSSGSSQS